MDVVIPKWVTLLILALFICGGALLVYALGKKMSDDLNYCIRAHYRQKMEKELREEQRIRDLENEIAKLKKGAKP